MKIAYVNPEHPPQSGLGHGGIATFIYTQASSMAQRGHTVHILLREGTIPDHLPANVRVHHYGFTPHKNILKRYLKRYFNNPIEWELGHCRTINSILRVIAEQDGLDVVEIPEYSGMAHELSKDIPCCIHFHTPIVLVDELNETLITSQRKLRYKLEREAARKGIIHKSCSEALKRDVSVRYKIDKNSISVIRNPISTTIFDSIEKHHTFDKRIDVLFVGRLERRKGAEIISRNLKSILDLDSRIHLTIVGETELGDSSSYRNAIERTLSPENRSRIWFLGPVSHKELPLIYCRSSVLFIPSLFDNAPYTLLEAMAAKLPVIASDSGGINEIIRNGENGLLFRLNDRESLLGCFSQFIANPQRMHIMAKIAYEEIKTIYAPDVIAEQTENFYSKAIRK